MKKISFLLLLFLLLSNITLAKEASPLRTLVIYCNESFASDWMQIGHPIKRAFEFQCNCKVEFVVLSDGTTTLSRAMLEGNKSRADLVVGLDISLIEKAKGSGIFAPLNISTNNLNLPIKWSDPYFIPYDYGYLAFIYNSAKLKNPPKSLQELIDYPNKNFKIIIQDPRTSLTGFSLLLWIKSLYPNNSVEIWRQLKKKILTVTKSWSESYSLFMHEEVDMVLGYTTSPIYHMMAENNPDIRATEFKEGHYLQVELIGKLKSSKEPELADQFIKFVLSPSFQHLILVNNFMLPVINLGDNIPKEYNSTFTPTKVFIVTSDELKEKRSIWIKEWLKALSKD